MTSGRILVVDDEPTVRGVVCDYLRQGGYDVRELDNGTDVPDVVEEFQPDLIVLDIMLPGATGLELLRDGATNQVPVILLTALAEETDRVVGLEFGADDYVTKPFSPRELVARVRSVLRRSAPVPDDGEHSEQDKPTCFDGLCIDRRAREVTVNGEQVTLTAKEFDLLAFFANSPRQVFSRSQLLEQVWDSSSEFQDPATVTVHVRRLRTKLEANPNEPRWIVTVFGVGYRFEP